MVLPEVVMIDNLDEISVKTYNIPLFPVLLHPSKCRLQPCVGIRQQGASLLWGSPWCSRTRHRRVARFFRPVIDAVQMCIQQTKRRLWPCSMESVGKALEVDTESPIPLHA